MRQVGAIVVLGAIGSILSLSSVNVAFEVLSRDLGSPIDTVQWVATGYLLGLAAVISTTGWLLRRVGARRLYLTTLALFVATSVLCSLATTIEQLIAFRVLQGVAGGATLPVGQMILVSVAGPGRMGRVMSVLGVPMLLAPVFGPVAGGVLIQELSWHALFLMNVPLALAALLLGAWRLPSLPPQPAGRFDGLGFALVLVGAPALVYGLAQAGETGSVAEPAVLVPTVIGLALLTLFVLHALRAENPLLDVRLWQDPGFAACAATAFLVSTALFGWMLVVPLYFQLARGEDPLSTGLLLMPQGLGAALSMALAGRLTDRIGGGRVALGGVSIVAAATAAFTFVGGDTPYWLVCGILTVRGLGIGGSVMPAMAAAYSTLGPRQISDATPQLNMLQRIGGSIGTTIVAVVLTRELDRAEAVAAPFTRTAVWSTALAVAAVVPAAVLARIDRRRPAALREPEAEATIV